jgi:hypothetical protein
VIYFLHSDDDPGFERTSPHYKLMDFSLTPELRAGLLHKDTPQRLHQHRACRHF